MIIQTIVVHRVFDGDEGEALKQLAQQNATGLPANLYYPYVRGDGANSLEMAGFCFGELIISETADESHETVLYHKLINCKHSILDASRPFLGDPENAPGVRLEVDGRCVPVMNGIKMSYHNNVEVIGHDLPEDATAELHLILDCQELVGEYFVGPPGDLDGRGMHTLLTLDELTQRSIG